MVKHPEQSNLTPKNKESIYANDVGSLFDNHELVKQLGAKFDTDSDNKGLEKIDPKNLSNKEKKRLEPFQTIYQDPYFGEEFLTVMINHADIIQYDNVVYLAKELQELKTEQANETYEEVMVITKDEMNSLAKLMTDASNNTELMKDFITQQKEETVTMDEIGESMKAITAGNREQFDNIQDTTYHELKKIFTEGEKLIVSVDKDLLHNMSVGLTYRYLKQVNMYIHDNTLSEVSGVPGEKKFTKAHIFQLVSSGPFSENGKTVLGGLNKQEKFNAIMERIKTQAEGRSSTEMAFSGVLDLKSPKRFYEFLGKYVDGQEEFTGFSQDDASQYEGSIKIPPEGKPADIEEVNYATEFAKEFDKLDTESKKSVTSFLKHFNEAKSQNIIDQFDGLTGMLADVSGMLGPVLMGLKDVLKVFGMGELYIRLKGLYLAGKGFLKPHEKVLVEKIQEGLGIAGEEGKYAVSYGNDAWPQQCGLLSQTLTTHLFDSPDALAEKLDEKTINKAFEDAPDYLTQEKNITDLLLYKVIRINNSNFGKTKIKEELGRLKNNDDTYKHDAVNALLSQYVDSQAKQLDNEYKLETMTMNNFLNGLAVGLVTGPVGVEHSVWSTVDMRKEAKTQSVSPQPQPQQEVPVDDNIETTHDGYAKTVLQKVLSDRSNVTGLLDSDEIHYDESTDAFTAKREGKTDISISRKQGDLQTQIESGKIDEAAAILKGQLQTEIASQRS